VRTRDGDVTGRVQLVILSQDRLEVTHLVIRMEALSSRDVTVPRELVLGVEDDGGTLHLKLARPELETAPRFDPMAYLAPTEARQRWARSGFLRRTYLSRPGDASLASDAFAVGDDTMIFDRAEEPVGVITGISFEALTGRVTGLACRLGSRVRTQLGGGAPVLIPATIIHRLVKSAAYPSGKGVTLSLQQAEIMRLTE
jgi:hypothetical protein